jgi:hypothetical protein
MSTETKQNTVDFDWRDYGENVAAISEMFFGDPKTYSNMIEKVGNQIGGSGGFFDFLARATKIFTDEAEGYSPGLKYHWHEAIEDYTDKFISYLSNGEIPDETKLHLLAAGSIELNFI